MLLSRERYAALRSDHDGANGWASKMCPACGTVHPCLTWIMATDMLEQLDRMHDGTGARR